MSLDFNKISINNIENGKTVQLVNEYLEMTAKDLFKMEAAHGIDPKKLKGEITIKITLQPLSDLEEHFSVSSEVSRKLPKITNSSIALRGDGGLFVQERGSDDNSPLQQTIENYLEENEELDKETGEILKINKQQEG